MSQKKLDELVAANSEKLKRLAEMGLVLDPIRIINEKLNMIFTELVPKTKQVAFNIAWNERLGEIADQVLAGAAVEQLQLPDTSKSLLVPKAALPSSK